MGPAMHVVSQRILPRYHRTDPLLDALHGRCTVVALALATGKSKAQLFSRELKHDSHHSNTVFVLHFYKSKGGFVLFLLLAVTEWSTRESCSASVMSVVLLGIIAKYLSL